MVKSTDEMPVTLNVEEVGEVLGISRATAYNLVNSKGFPVLRIGKRIVVPKNALLKWMEEQTGVGS